MLVLKNNYQLPSQEIMINIEREREKYSTSNHNICINDAQQIISLKIFIKNIYFYIICLIIRFELVLSLVLL